MGKLCIPCFPVLYNERKRAEKEGQQAGAEDSKDLTDGHYGNLNTFLFTSLIIIYLVFGALIFRLLESRQEGIDRQTLRHYIGTFLGRFPCVTRKHHATVPSI